MYSASEEMSRFSIEPLEDRIVPSLIGLGLMASVNAAANVHASILGNSFDVGTSLGTPRVLA